MARLFPADAVEVALATPPGSAAGVANFNVASASFQPKREIVERIVPFPSAAAPHRLLPQVA